QEQPGSDSFRERAARAMATRRHTHEAPGREPADLSPRADADSGVSGLIPMTRAVRLTSIVTLLAAVALIAGCATPDNGPTQRSTDVFTVPPTSAAPSPATTATPVDPQCDPNNPAASLRPTGPTPAPGQMPAGSTMAKIFQNAHLTVGVDQNTLLFGYRNPRTNTLEGFDIDVAHEIARAIFGDPNAIDY